MLCNKCGNEIPKGKKFCTNCGQELNIKKTVTANIIFATVLSILLVCIIPYLIGIIAWLYLYSLVVLPLLLFMTIISYGRFYKNKIKSKSIIITAIIILIVSMSFGCFVNRHISDASIILPIPNIILSFLVAFKRNEIKAFVFNNIKNKE